MYLSVRKFSNVKSPDIVLKSVETQLLPALKGLPGFKAYYATQFEDGDLGAVSIFDKKENADLANEKASKWIRENLADHVSKEPTVIRGNIMFTHAAPQNVMVKSA